MLVSLICVYNKLNEYKNMSCSLKKQDISYELIGVDNTSNKFSSAAKALNYGASKAGGGILVFLHQDILFEEKDSLKKFIEPLDTYKSSIIGIYGASKYPKKLDEGLTQVDTLDECCIAMPKDVYNSLKFNEDICDGWHLYVVELCLRAKRNGISIISKQSSIKHLSNGTVDERYMKTFKNLIKEYKDDKYISTTCKSMPTSYFYFDVYYVIWKIKKILFGNFPLMYKLKSLKNK